MSHTSYLISEASKKAGVEPHVLRYWEEELKLPIARNEMGHRYYTRQDIQIFLSIKELKRRGFQLKTIKELVPKLEETVYTDECADGDGVSRGISGIEEKTSKELSSRKNQKRKGNIEKQENPKDKHKDNKKSDKIHTPSGIKVVVHRKDLPVKPAAAKQEDPVLKVQIGEREVSQLNVERKDKEQLHDQVKEQTAKQRGGAKTENVQKGQAVTAAQTKRNQQNQEKLKMEKRQAEFYQILERLFQQLLVPNQSEERYKRLDATIRKHQYSRRLVAATEEQGKKRKKKYTKTK